jgi:hypothetical protein
MLRSKLGVDIDIRTRCSSVDTALPHAPRGDVADSLAHVADANHGKTILLNQRSDFQRNALSP